MGYVLFAQKKLVLNSLIQSTQLQLSQRSDEQLRLSTDSANLKIQMAYLNERKANELADLYESLTKSYSDTEIAKMTDLVNNKDTANGGITDEEWAVRFEGVNRNQTSINELKENSRDKIQLKINAIEKDYERYEANIDKRIAQASLKEGIIENTVKTLETKVTAYQKQLEKIEEAEGKGIEASVPKFSGIG